jgi:hypothetical protein
MNHYFGSDGTRYSSAQVKRYTDKAKAQRIEMCKDEKGYVWCFDCEENNDEPIDMSHDKSVQWCKDNCCVELAWDVDNIKPRHRSCHMVKDGLTLQFSRAV